MEVYLAHEKSNGYLKGGYECHPCKFSGIERIHLNGTNIINLVLLSEIPAVI